MKSKLLFVSLVILSIAFVSSGCGNSNQNSDTNSPAANESQTPAEPNTVAVVDYKFAPEKLTVKKGTTVTWKNGDNTRHTVTSDDSNGPLDIELKANGSGTYTFNTVGTFDYHCEPHPFMKGTIEVTE